MEKINRLQQRRKFILLLLLLLMSLSFLNMISAAFYMSSGNIKKHCINIGIFFISYFIIGYSKRIKKYSFNYKILSNRKINIIIFFLSVLILFLMFIGRELHLSLIKETNGAYGWIKFGRFSLQPAEILKCGFIVNIANCLAKAEDKEFSEKKIIINATIYLIIYLLLILGQKDLGTAIHYIVIWIFMVSLSKIKDKWIIGFGIFSTILISSATYIMYKLPMTNYKIMRVKSYINGLFLGKYSDDYGYQVKQSIYAFGSGGVFGKGYANGVQKYSYLPEVHTDFIMATLGEEFGIVGLFFVLILIYILFYIIISTSRECKNYFGKYLSMGIGILIITQVFINIFVAVGLLPVFGLPMPFFSYGGSAMLTLGICLGLILNMNIE